MLGRGHDETEAALAAMGMKLEGPANDFEVWPDHVQAVEVFASLLTQWRLGQKGVIGLDYAAIPAVLEMKRVGRDDWPELFDQIRVMENEAVKVINGDT
jgi:hypothetical protein